MVAQKNQQSKRDKNNYINAGETVCQHANITKLLVLHIWHSGVLSHKSKDRQYSVILDGTVLVC
jgi:hypothetical protein